MISRTHWHIRRPHQGFVDAAAGLFCRMARPCWAVCCVYYWSLVLLIVCPHFEDFL